MERFNSFASDQIILNKRQASMIMASMLLFCLFIFIVGFFLGKRATIDDFSQKVSKDALHDQIDFLLTTQSLQSSQDDIHPAIENSDPFSLSAQSLHEYSREVPDKIITVEQEAIAPVVAIASEKNISQVENKEVKSPKISPTPEIVQPSGHNQKNQYAQLIGFGTKKAAESFVARLKKHHVPVVLKTNISKSAAGKQRVWYQAITPTYQSSQELQAQVAKVKRLEHIRDADIKIVYVK